MASDAAWASEALAKELTLTPDQARFFAQATGISDDRKLEEHIVRVQQAALAVRPYRCIATFAFLDFRASSLPAYARAMKLRHETDTLFLDVGCFVGTDLRKAIADGWPADRILGTDLEPDFIALGRQLFKEPEDAKVPSFIAGDLFSETFMNTSVPLPRVIRAPPMYALTDLTPMGQQCAVINAGSLFHLFDEATQVTLAKRLLHLLARRPDALIMGGQVGVADGDEGPQPSSFKATYTASPRSAERYLHSPSSWKALWADLAPHLRCEVELADTWSVVERADRERRQAHRLVWSVTRVM